MGRENVRPCRKATELQNMEYAGLLGYVPMLLCDQLSVQSTTMFLQFAVLGKNVGLRKLVQGFAENLPENTSQRSHPLPSSTRREAGGAQAAQCQDALKPQPTDEPEAPIGWRRQQALAKA